MSDVLPPISQNWSAPITYTELSHHRIDPQSIHNHLTTSPVRNYQPPELYGPFEFVRDQRSVSENNILDCTLRSWLKVELERSDSSSCEEIKAIGDTPTFVLDSTTAKEDSCTKLAPVTTPKMEKNSENECSGVKSPSPYAETYNYDSESASSHSTLIRPIEGLKFSRSKTWACMPRISRLTSPPNSVSSGSTVCAVDKNSRAVEGGKFPDTGPQSSRALGTLDKDLKANIEPDLVAKKSNRTKRWAESLAAETSAMASTNAEQTSDRTIFPVRRGSDRDAESVAQLSITSTARSEGGSKDQNLARKALFAGASEAFKVCNEEGSWRADNGKRAITAAMNAGGIDNEHARKMVEDIFTGFFQAPKADSDDVKSVDDEMESIAPSTRRVRNTSNRSDRHRVPSPVRESRYSDSDSSVANSSEDEKRVKKAKGKELLGAGLALVSTLNAATNIYEMFEKREARQSAIMEGETTPEEARKLEAKATLQDAASVGISALGIKEVVSRWKNASDNRKEAAEMSERAAQRALLRR